MSEWIKWTYTKEKPYPETLDTELTDVRFADGEEHETSFNVGWWHDSYHSSNFHPSAGTAQIVAYKVAS